MLHLKSKRNSMVGELFWAKIRAHLQEHSTGKTSFLSPHSKRAHLSLYSYIIPIINTIQLGRVGGNENTHAENQPFV